MSRILAILIVLLSAVAQATTISIPDSGVSFDAPADFTPLTPAEIATKYPSSRAPQWVVGNSRRSTTIAYDLQQDRLTPSDLPKVKQAFEQVFERVIPGLQWKKRHIVRIQNQDWVWLEFTSQAVDTDIYNIMLATSREGRLLIFNFNSTKSEFPSVESILRRSIDSITVEKR